MPSRLTTSQRHILKEGKPWFYLADTAWELFHRLTLEESTHYLEVRARQQFTVIQAVLLAEFEGLRVPNRNGHVPFTALDPTSPDEFYFLDCDAVINEAERLGLVVGLLPTWGDKWSDWGAGP